MEPTLAPPLQLDFCTVLSESRRITNAHSRHFLALSVLFLLPLCFSLSVYPTLQYLLTQPPAHNTNIFLSNPLLPQDPSNDLPLKSLLLVLLFSLFVIAFSLLATGSITYSVYHGFYGRPVKLLSAIKSAFACFFPLLITAFCAEIIVSGLFVACGLILFSAIKGSDFMGFQAQLDSPFFVAVCGVLGVVLVVCLVFLQLNWTLASVVVVVESSWGLEPLKRSNFLVKGMRKVALSVFLFTALFAGIWLFTASRVDLGIDTSDGWKSWAFVLHIVTTSTLLMLMFLQNLAANAVLYMYCKAIHGELAWEIAEEFARDYISLPFDDGKVPHVVSVAYT